MHLFSFRKPAYRLVNLLALILLITGIFFEASGFSGIYIIIGSIAGWLVLTSIGVFRIQFNYFVKAINSVPVAEKLVAVSFDDGPHEQTEELLKLLGKYNAKATFFMIGRNATRYSDTVKKVFENGHQIGNHTLNHLKLFTGMKTSDVKKEIQETSLILNEITGEEPGIFRPPFGITNPRIALAIRSLQMQTVGWSIRSLDTVIDTADKIIVRINKRIKPGAIILLHDHTPYVLPVLEYILSEYTKKGYKFVTVEHLLESNK